MNLHKTKFKDIEIYEIFSMDGKIHEKISMRGYYDINTKEEYLMANINKEVNQIDYNIKPKQSLKDNLINFFKRYL